jgi:glyoxylase-like metal-dependent hydrolase (beta-lactamase superfamily II)
VTTPPAFDKDALPQPNRLEPVSPLIRRLVAPNGGPFTATGTCTYVIGQGKVSVVDPGPDDPAHLDRLIAALGTEEIAQIILTHTHRDHADGVARLKALTGAKVYGCGPHIAARALGEGESNPLDASANRDYAPDAEMREGDVLSAADHHLQAIHTPGHTANHLTFLLREENRLLSGDHVMAWSTSIVAPPDGSMGDYMRSLEKLLSYDVADYWPGHGGPVREPARFVRALIHHRRMREASILHRIKEGDRSIADIVTAIYQNLNPRLIYAARLSVFAHLEDMVERNTVRCEGPLTLEGLFTAP